MDQRRVLIAFVLMALVLVASQWWYAQLAPPEEGVEPDTTRLVGRTDPDRDREASPAVDPVDVPAARPPDTTGPAVRDTTEPSDPDTTAPAAGTESADTLAPRPPAGPPVIVETPLYRATIRTRGATFEQVEILSYASFTADTTAVLLIPRGGVFLERAADLDERRTDLDALDYTPSVPAIRLTADDTAATLRLVAGEIVQSYRFRPDSYVIDYALDLGEPADGVLVTGLGPRLRSNEKNPSEDYSQLRAAVRIDGDIVTASAGDVDEDAMALGGRIDWAGLRNKYFLAAVLGAEDGPDLTAATIRGSEADSLPVLRLAVGAPIEGGVSRGRVYLGPQEYGRLHAVGEDLDEVNQYGWSWIRWMITPFAKMIVVAMVWLHQFIPSYGLVLITIALLVRLAMWPLTVKSYRSIRAMQKIQPEIQQIRERHKDDPQKMQQETMRLYKEKKVNPLGGCLPNLIPMPILFAMFFVFQSTIELRDQAFLWLPDLSQADPVYILPVFMGLTMFATSKMTATDPKMSAMTYVMPIVLTFVFLNLASGLVLYYAFGNLVTFGQQYWLRETETPEVDDRADEGGDEG